MRFIVRAIGSILSVKSIPALSLLVFAMIAGCNDAPRNDQQTVAVVTVGSESLEEESGNDAYPDSNTSTPNDVSSEAYAPPTVEGLLANPPSPDFSLPTPEQDLGVIGGVLIREVIEAGGYLPVVPKSLYLGEIVYADNGTPVYVRRNTESPRAELFETGVFLFNNVPPGQYGLIIDLGFTEQILTTQDGSNLTVILAPGDVIDLGQVFVTLSGN